MEVIAKFSCPRFLGYGELEVLRAAADFSIKNIN
jgi:hypothetical protein